MAVVTESERPASPYVAVRLDQTVAELLATNGADSLASTFGMGGGAPNVTLGIGDQVVVTIFEAAAGGLFSGDAGVLGPSKSVSLPPQPVTRAGTISIPYVGSIRVEGMTPDEVQRAIVAALKDKAIEPQVIVTVSGAASTFVTIAGDVAKPGRHPLTLKGDRVLDVIAESGGTRAADYDSFVRLTRNNRTATVSLARIVRDQGQNIYLRPDDLLYIYTDPQKFTAFGATLRNANFPFQTDRLTLAEAIGMSGGLNDSRADPRGVFVFRYEDPDSYALISGGKEPPPGSAGVPVVYAIDMKDPRAYFVTQRFLMRDNDVLYVSNAPATEVQKALSILTGGIGTANAASITATRLQQ